MKSDEERGEEINNTKKARAAEREKVSGGNDVFIGQVRSAEYFD